MANEIKSADRVLKKVDDALGKLKDVAQGRIYRVGTKVMYQGKFGVVTVLNQGSQDPTASTVNIRLEDGTLVDDIAVSATTLELFRQ